MNTIKKIIKSFFELIKRLFIPQKKAIIDVYKEEALLSPGRVVARRFFKNKLAITGIVGFSLIFMFSFGLSLFIPLNESYTNTFHRNLPPNYQYLNVPNQLVNEGVVDIQSGNANSIGLSEAGNVYVWGATYRDLKNIPQEVRNANIVEIASGTQHFMAKDSNGRWYMWGYNHMQQAQIHERFVQALQTDPIDKMFGGYERTIAITQSGAVYIWGVGANNVGDVMTRSPYIYYQNNDNTQPRIKAVQAVSNFNNAMILLEDGTIRMIGIASDISRELPIELTNGTVKVVEIGVTIYNAFALDETGRVHVWGSDAFGLTNDSIPEGAITNIKSLGVGYQHAVTLSNDGTLYAWGDNNIRQTNIPSNATDIQRIFVDSNQNYAIDENGRIHTWGLKGFIFGSDEQGRDFVIQLIHGGRITLVVGAVAVIISITIGVTVGLTAGYFGGRIDNLLMRFAEIVSSFPFLPFAITLSALMLNTATTQTQRMLVIMFILGILSWTGLARLIRGQILSERERDYVLAAKALGIKQRHIIWRHVFPAIISIVIVNATLGYAGSLLTEAGLSFLGFGVQKPSPSWGNILTAAQDINVIRLYWWRWILPGLAIIIAALSINLMGDALRDAMDPKNAER